MKTRTEWLLAAKILFIIGALMLMVTVRNAAALPAAQFIYGRF